LFIGKMIAKNDSMSNYNFTKIKARKDLKITHGLEDKLVRVRVEKRKPLVLYEVQQTHLHNHGRRLKYAVVGYLLL
jgi:hypothetical protein